MKIDECYKSCLGVVLRDFLVILSDLAVILSEAKNLSVGKHDWHSL